MRIIEFAIASALIEATPGPNMSYLVALALTHGTKAGFQAVAGVACGLLAIGLLAAFGLAEFISHYPLIGGMLRWGGILFMLWLAVESWQNAGKSFTARSSEAFGSFWRGLITNLLNPKLVIFYVAMLPDFIDKPNGNLFLKNITLVLIYSAIATLIHSGLVLFAGHIRLFMDIEKNAKTIERIMAALLLGVAIWIIIEVRPY